MTPVLSKAAPAPLILKKKTFWRKFSQHFQRKSYFSKTYPFVVKLCFSYHLFKFQAELCCFLHFSDYFGNEKVKGQLEPGLNSPAPAALARASIPCAELQPLYSSGLMLTPASVMISDNSPYIFHILSLFLQSRAVESEPESQELDDFDPTV